MPTQYHLIKDNIQDRYHWQMQSFKDNIQVRLLKAVLNRHLQGRVAVHTLIHCYLFSIRPKFLVPISQTVANSANRSWHFQAMWEQWTTSEQVLCGVAVVVVLVVLCVLWSAGKMACCVLCTPVTTFVSMIRWCYECCCTCTKPSDHAYSTTASTTNLIMPSTSMV